ncbi:MAG: DUF4331 family protein [Acidobacteria bacterium]|nr:DUF4331 family protein [Acidobacteriota bacterium]
MFKQLRKTSIIALVLAVALIILLTPPLPTDAADHGDAPFASLRATADITDFWVFLDPNDNTRLELIMGTRGFIVPGENANFGIFDGDLRYRFNIENTGDGVPDLFLDAIFSKQIGRTTPQTGTVTLSDARGTVLKTFTAPATLSSSTAAVAPTRNITADSNTGIRFFAGLADDAFFFDVPSELRYRASLEAGTPGGDISFFTRGRDTFAGYNINAIAYSVPVSLLKGRAGNVLGISAATQIRKKITVNSNATTTGKGDFVQIDSMGIPAVNIVFVPFERKDDFNTKGPDATSFANDIVGQLKILQTRDANIALFAKLAVEKGDYLRIDTSIANTGPEGGNNSGAGFPNGRRLLDDVTDPIVSLVSNSEPRPDMVDKNDVLFLNNFPWVALPNQPLPRGSQDTTQN